MSFYKLICCVRDELAQLGTGLIRSIITSKDHSKLDVIPVDMTANAVIAAGWRTATDKLVVFYSSCLCHIWRLTETFDDLFREVFCLQCSDTVGWATGRGRPVKTWV